MITTMNFNCTKVCASCKHWDDPTRVAIQPLPGRGFWKVDLSKRCLCFKKRVVMRADNRCSMHESRV